MSWKSAFEIGHAMDEEPNFIVTFTFVSHAAEMQIGGEGAGAIRRRDLSCCAERDLR